VNVRHAPLATRLGADGARRTIGVVRLAILQVLVGAWPLDVERAVAYATKAMREAKAGTSWIDLPAGPWVDALTDTDRPSGPCEVSELLDRLPVAVLRHLT
jgi:hypothetical protein